MARNKPKGGSRKGKRRQNHHRSKKSGKGLVEQRQRKAAESPGDPAPLLGAGGEYPLSSERKERRLISKAIHEFDPPPGMLNAAAKVTADVLRQGTKKHEPRDLSRSVNDALKLESRHRELIDYSRKHLLNQDGISEGGQGDQEQTPEADANNGGTIINNISGDASIVVDGRSIASDIASRTDPEVIRAGILEALDQLDADDRAGSQAAEDPAIDAGEVGGELGEPNPSAGPEANGQQSSPPA